MQKPLVVYVSGAPGSGKTTLARKISAEMYIPHVSSDLIHGGIRFTRGNHDRRTTLHEVFVPLLVDMAKKNISFVVDQVLQRNVSENDIIAKLKPYAQLVYLHLWADNSVERHFDREVSRKDRGIVLTAEELVARQDYHIKNLPNTESPLEIDVPRLEINTRDNYKPELSEIVAFILDNHKGEM